MLALKDLDLKDKTVFLRVDLNVPLDKEQNITNDARIQAVLPSLQHLLENGSKVIAASHLGRPKGKIVPELTLNPVAQRLQDLIPQKVLFAQDVIGEDSARLKNELQPGEVLLLENIRFHIGEKENDTTFSQKLAEGIDVYVNDAFGTCHRAHASVVGIPQYVSQKAAGFLVEKEVAYLKKLISPEKPYTAILGGAKVSDKIPVITNLLNKADDILIGGAMAYTFFAAQGMPTGLSLVEEDKLELALDLLGKAQNLGVNLILPVDHLTAEKMEPFAATEIQFGFPIPAGRMALDIGPETVRHYSEIISRAKTIFWNGPMGVFEIDQFSQGTQKIAEAVADSAALSVVGGGDSVAALYKAGVQEHISHISTGGGASLEFVANESLPGLDALNTSE
jgi:phosphoglycerate kinase